MTPTAEQIQALKNGREIPLPITEMCKQSKIDPWVCCGGLERDLLGAKLEIIELKKKVNAEIDSEVAAWIARLTK